MRKQVHVVYDDFSSAWILKRNLKIIGAANTKKTALIFAAAYAEKHSLEVKIHSKATGKIQNSNSYGTETSIEDKVH
jgi:hypothetical protein